MIHEAMLLEYSARHLALLEWAAGLKLFNYACIGFALFLPWGVSTRSSGPRCAGRGPAGAGVQARRQRAPASHSSRRCRRSCACSGRRNFSPWPSCSRCSACWCTCCWERDGMTSIPFDLQLLNFCAALLLLLSFAMLAQRRIVTLVNLLAIQGAVLLARHAAARMAHGRAPPVRLRGADAGSQGHPAAVDPPPPHPPAARCTGTPSRCSTFPAPCWWDCWSSCSPSGWRSRSRRSASTATRNAIGIAVAVILLSFITMITRRKAMSQVVGFLSMENGLFFGAMSATYGMPMIVEFGSRWTCWSAVLVLGVFFFQIREQFDSLDLHHLESLKEGAVTRSSRCCSCLAAARCTGAGGLGRSALAPELNIASRAPSPSSRRSRSRCGSSAPDRCSPPASSSSSIPSTCPVT